MLSRAMNDFLSNPGLALRTSLTCLLIVLPLYLLLRYFVKLVRQAYGFEPQPEEDGPPLRVCGACHNTVLEADFVHCPYCGGPLPAAEGATPADPVDLSPDGS